MRSINSNISLLFPFGYVKEQMQYLGISSWSIAVEKRVFKCVYARMNYVGERPLIGLGKRRNAKAEGAKKKDN